MSKVSSLRSASRKLPSPSRTVSCVCVPQVLMSPLLHQFSLSPLARTLPQPVFPLPSRPARRFSFGHAVSCHESASGRPSAQRLAEPSRVVPRGARRLRSHVRICGGFGFGGGRGESMQRVVENADHLTRSWRPVVVLDRKEARATTRKQGASSHGRINGSSNEWRTNRHPSRSRSFAQRRLERNGEEAGQDHGGSFLIGKARRVFLYFVITG